MIKENDRVKTLVESEGYKAGLIGVVIFVSPDGKYCDVELCGKEAILQELQVTRLINY